jgi:heme/copper-type cytochrome/quinol oxidase subunit 4
MSRLTVRSFAVSVVMTLVAAALVVGGAVEDDRGVLWVAVAAIVIALALLLVDMWTARRRGWDQASRHRAGQGDGPRTAA